MANNILLGNANHSYIAQNNLLQLAYEMSAGLLIITEPHRLPQKEDWFTSSEQSPTVAIFYKKDNKMHLPIFLIARHEGIVIVKWGCYICIGIYQSPNKPTENFERKLKLINDVICNYQNEPILIAGDFNSRHKFWDKKRTNRRGILLENWLDRKSFKLINPRFVPTCINARGSSVIDLLLGNSYLLKQGVKCEVGEVIPGSDHTCITLHIKMKKDLYIQKAINAKFPKWNYKKLDVDIFRAAILAESWTKPKSKPINADSSAKNIIEMVTRATNVSAPRSGNTNRKKVYWWTDEIAICRTELIKQRRIYLKFRKKGNTNRLEAAKNSVKQYRSKMKKLIKKAKDICWMELMNTLDEDPWGRPYKIITKKLKTKQTAICESLPCEKIEEIVKSLFPAGDLGYKDTSDARIVWINEYEIKESELKEAIKKLSADKKAPGPDGLLGGILSHSMGDILKTWRSCFNSCLQEGCFPDIWKIAKLVLIRKKNDPLANSPGDFRPICLLDEASKILERIIANRLNAQLESTNGLQSNQYGFRKSRSTLDAILKVKEIIMEAINNGHCVTMICIDIKNAFNSLPWSTIKKGLDELEIPGYLRAILNSYLKNRKIVYVNNIGKVTEKEVNCGVPQGSALGPILWNVGYNAILKTKLPVEASIVCYADDIALLVKTNRLESAAYNASIAVGTIIRKIENLGLEVAITKTETIRFVPPARKLGNRYNNNYVLRVKDQTIFSKKQLKYLGLLIDDKWSFYPHIKHVTQKALIALESLRNIMPNLKGPNEKNRKLYVNAITSIITYAAPIWATDVNKNSKTRVLLNEFDRKAAQRISRAYRTTSRVAALIMARMIPTMDQAKKLESSFKICKNLEAELGRRLEHQERKVIGQRALLEAKNNWLKQIKQAGEISPGKRTRQAMILNLDNWYNRDHGVITYYITQVLTGHGCFNDFLFKIGKTNSPGCDHCDEEHDNAQHTLEDCKAWDEERRRMIKSIGSQLRINRVVNAMVSNRKKWAEISRFCTAVMGKKEAAERSKKQINLR